MDPNDLGQRVLEITREEAPWVDCDGNCDGRGVEVDAWCAKCNGKGLVRQPFVLHSGAETLIRYDCGRLFLHEHRDVLEECIKWFREQLPRDGRLIGGIPTLGACLAALAFPERFSTIYPIGWARCVVDDVATTGASLRPFLERGAKAVVLIKRLDVGRITCPVCDGRGTFCSGPCRGIGTLPNPALADITALVEVG